MTTLLVIFLVFIIIGLVLWVRELKKSLKEHFLIEGELQYEVGHDELTGLVNEPVTIDRLSESLKSAQRYKKKIAVLYIGIDYFKQINSATGFDVSNEFLQVLAQRFEENIRSSDTAAIVNGDEFILLLDDCDDSVFVQKFIPKIMDISKEIFEVQHHKINVTFSIGISVYPNDNVDALTLLSHAYSAMNMVKNKGGNDYKFYTPELAKQAFLNAKLEDELVESLKKNEIEVYYQAQIDNKNNEIIGVEAFSRWKHPEMGVCLSREFILLAEEIGFIVEIDNLVIQEAIAQCRKWYESGLEYGTLSINISLRTLQQDGFMKKIRNILDENEYIKEHLVFEIKEAHIMNRSSHCIEQLHELDILGIKFTVDNFGTASSSLRDLKKLPLSKLKIDRALIENILGNEENKTIVRTIIGIAENMNIGVIAEGVETQQQSDFLLESSCTQMQGHLFHEPIPAHEIEKILKVRT